jgi:hypothetical protein
VFLIKYVHVNILAVPALISIAGIARRSFSRELTGILAHVFDVRFLVALKGDVTQTGSC